MFHHSDTEPYDFKSLVKPKRKNKREESQVVNACIRWLWTRGVYCWRQNTGAYKAEGRYISYGTPGCADIIGVIPVSGRMICVECKSSKGVLSEHQKRFRERVMANNGLYIVARTIDDLEAMRAEMGL